MIKIGQNPFKNFWRNKFFKTNSVDRRFCIWVSDEPLYKDEESQFNCFKSPLAAKFFNPYHSNKTKLCEVVPQQIIAEDNISVSCNNIALGEEITIPEITNTQMVTFAILCALEVYRRKEFVSWANKWLKGKSQEEKSLKVIFEVLFKDFCKYNSNDNLESYQFLAGFNSVYTAYNYCWTNYDQIEAFSKRSVNMAIKANPNLNVVNILDKAIRNNFL